MEKPSISSPSEGLETERKETEALEVERLRWIIRVSLENNAWNHKS